MVVHIRNSETDRSARELASSRSVGLTEAIDVALREALKREEEKVPPRERLRGIAKSLAQYPDTGLKADKAFMDEMSGE